MFENVMISSTAQDLPEHRDEVRLGCESIGISADQMMENLSARDADAVKVSLEMVENAEVYICILAWRYGYVPPGSDISITEMEYDRAVKLGKPRLVFFIHDDHPVKRKDVETGTGADKLQAFKERIGQERVGAFFKSPSELRSRVGEALANLAKEAAANVAEESPTAASGDSDELTTPKDTLEINLPPYLRAVPRYLGSHDFVGRVAELNTLDDWCLDADPNPMLLFEAIGGTGKSMVAWTWLTGRAVQARNDWAGRFWFSFYEQGATMNAFCRAALAYMTGAPIEEFRKQRTRTLMPRLLAELEARPWLIVLDGLERILVAYHRIDAPQMRDEDVDAATDQISNRDPRATINPEDEDLLQRLTAAAPSKLLVTSRLTPQALINQSSMPRPGVRREMLSGLRPADAELLFQSCWVSGDSKAVQGYLQHNCDCHPLVIGALAGLVNDYLPDRGNFDSWLSDPEAGGKLGLADLDLTQRRNHILDAAILALPEPELRLLQTLSLLRGGSDYASLRELCAHSPARPKDGAHKEPKERFDGTLTELERRGLLQYDSGLKRYDLHPVVRGVAAGRMDEAETGEIGEQLVDYFSGRPHDPWEQADSLDDLSLGIQLVATLNRMGSFDRAATVLNGGLSDALVFNLMALGELQPLLRAFFPQGWDGPLVDISAEERSFIINSSGLAVDRREPAIAQRLFERALQYALKGESALAIRALLSNIAIKLVMQAKVRDAQRLREMALELAKTTGKRGEVFRALLDLYASAVTQGEISSADEIWSELHPMGRSWLRVTYRPGDAEHLRAKDKFRRAELTDTELVEVVSLCREGRNREALSNCLVMWGEWHLSRDEANPAIDRLSAALRLYREFGEEDTEGEALLTLAQLRAGQPLDVREVAERLDGWTEGKALLTVAEIWRELGEPERAVAAALRAHKSASGSGEPYVDRYYLDRADALLRELGETPPEVPQHDPANDEVFEWEDDVRALIDKTRKEREELEREQAERDEADD
ncbi:MAG: DUF4062 domain-containing protein [Pseudomonadota bacterium]